MPRPDGDGPLRSTVPPFHATAVTLSSSSGDRRAHWDATSASGAWYVHVALHLIGRIRPVAGPLIAESMNRSRFGPHTRKTNRHRDERNQGRTQPTMPLGAHVMRLSK